MDKIKVFLIKAGEIFNKTVDIIGTIPSRIASLWSMLVANYKIFSSTKSYFIIRKIVFYLLLVVALFQVVFAVLIYGFHQENSATRIAAKIVPYPISVSNYDFVTMEQYLKEKDYIHHFYGATNQDNINFKDIDSQILDQLIENKIISMEAMRHRVKVIKKDVDQSVATIVDQNGGQDKVVKVLNDLYGLSLNDFRKLIEIQLLRDKLNDAVIAKVTVRHILIRVDTNATQATIDAAKAKIDGIKTEITGGLDFGDAAKKYSEDSGSADQGGLLDPFAKGEMVAPFSDAAFATATGSVSNPVRTEFGWHIIKLESRTGTIEMTFTDWLASLKKKSLILKLYKI